MKSASLTGDGADARAHERGLPLVDPLDHQPGEERARRGDLRVDGGVGGDRVGAQRGPGVEPEPAEPQQARAVAVRVAFEIKGLKPG